jgi:hypothetical protein
VPTLFVELAVLAVSLFPVDQPWRNSQRSRPHLPMDWSRESHSNRSAAVVVLEMRCYAFAER